MSNIVVEIVEEQEVKHSAEMMFLNTTEEERTEAVSVTAVVVAVFAVAVAAVVVVVVLAVLRAMLDRI